MSLISTALLIVPVIIFSGPLVTFFNSDPIVYDFGVMFLRFLTPFYLFWCANQIYSGALRGAGNSLVPMIIMLGSFVVFRQVYLYIMANFISNTILPIVMAFPAGWVLAAVITYIYYRAKGLSHGVRVAVDITEEKEKA